MAIAIVALLTVCLAAVNGRIIDFGTCSNVQTSCVIHEVRIEPCKVTKVVKPCVVKKAHNTTIFFDFTTDFSAEKLENMVYWDSGDKKPEFSGIENDACKYTTCPAEAGKRQSYTYILNPPRVLPSGTFPIEWKVWNANNASQVCCFTTSIKLPL